MALTGQTPGIPDYTYRGLLNMNNDASGLTASLRNVKDGLGNNSGIRLSTAEFEYSGIFTFASKTASTLIYLNASKQVTSLAAGTDGQVLTLASGLPSWAAAADKGLRIGTTGVISGSLQAVQDAAGTATGLELSNIILKYTGAMQIAGIGATGNRLTITDSVVSDGGVNVVLSNTEALNNGRCAIKLASSNAVQTNIISSQNGSSGEGIVRGLTIQAQQTNGRFAVALGQAYLGTGAITWAIMQDSNIEHHAINSASNYLTQSIDASSNVAWTISGGTVPTITFNSPFIARIRPRTAVTNAPGATPSTDTDALDFKHFTGLNTAITSMTTNLTGTPTEAQKLWLAFTDNGTGRAITWGASFENGPATLPTTTVASTRLDVGFIWNTVTSKWRCVAAG